MAARPPQRYAVIMSDVADLAWIATDGDADRPQADPTPLDWAQAAEARMLAAACQTAAEGVRGGAAVADRAANAAGLSPADAQLLLAQGPRDLAALLWRRHDAEAQAVLAKLDPAELKIRERIRTAVLARIDAAMADRPAVQAASLFLARPDNAGLALTLGWTTADGLWRWAGDTSTDGNHYSKRALLCTILASTMLVRLTRDEDAAARHLDDRIAQVMGFETWKAKLPPLQDGLTVLAANLGRLRYRS